jgi:amino acid transporter
MGLLTALNFFYPGISSSISGKVIISIVIILLSYLNYLGVRVGAGINNFLSIAKIIPLLLFVFIGFAHTKIQNLTGQPIPSLPLISLGFLQVLYVFTGFEEMPVPASEVKEPRKTIPHAYFIVLISVALIYILIQYVAQAACPGIINQKDAPLAFAAQSFAGTFGGILLGLGAVISMAGVNSGIALTGPRSLYALSRDRYLPGVLSKIHPQFQTPYISIIVNSSIVLALTLSGTYAQLICMVSLASLLQYIPTCLAVIVLRKRKPEIERKFVIPGGYIIPVIAVITCILLFIQASMYEIIISLLLPVIAIPIYFISKKRIEY